MALCVRLLTFDQLPNRQLVGDLSPFTEVYETLDSTAAFFENYYLQSPGADSLLGNADALSAVQGLLAAAGLSAVLIEVGSNEAASVFKDVPDWFQRRSLRRLNDQFVLPDDCAIVWMHCSLALQDNSAEGDAAGIEECLQVLRGLDQETRSPLFVTSLQGCNQPPDFPFESHVFEGVIRVPLWVETSNQECCRIQKVAGSFDVMQTVRQCLRPDESFQSVTPEGFQRTSLLKMIAEAGQSPDRQLLIQTQQTIAIRTETFLFLQTNGANVSELNSVDFALYSKPEDIWNIHDVSAEYHELVHEFSQQIKNRSM